MKNIHIRLPLYLKRRKNNLFEKEYGRKLSLNEESYITLGLVFFSLILLFITKEYYANINQNTDSFNERIKQSFISFIGNTSREISVLPYKDDSGKIVKETDPIDNILSNLNPNIETIEIPDLDKTDNKLEEIVSSLNIHEMIGSSIITSKENQEKGMELNPQLSDFDRDAYLELMRLYNSANISLERILELSKIERRETIKIEGPRNMLEARPVERQGIREKQEVDRVIDSYMPKFNYCYFRAKQKNSHLKGYIVIRFGILPGGTIERKSVRIIENTLRDNSVGICLKKRIYGIRGFSSLPLTYGTYYVTQKFSYD